MEDKIRIVKLSEIREELRQHLERQELFPVIGSGFARGCRAKFGRGEAVPSGKDMQEYMVDYLQAKGHRAPPNSSFSKVARYYEQLAEKADVTKYLKERFIDVELDSRRKSFLKINWKLIYTLNLDDAIEKNSEYHAIMPNRKPQLDALKDEKCVFKLHGDAFQYISYGNTQDKILNLVDYITSLESSSDLLEKLTIDLNYSNAIFIGCSLSDEYDLLSVAQKLQVEATSQRNRYFVTSERPDEYLKMDLLDYKIDTVILVDSYEDFYDEFITLASTCEDTAKEELREFLNLSWEAAPAKKNTDYLICGKYLLDKSKKTVMFPRFFIEREIEERILAGMGDSPLQIVHGARISGKSYLLASLLRKIHNRDTYYFDSRNHVNSDLLQHLLEQKHSVLLFDTNVLTIDTLKELLHSDFDRMKKEGINVVCCINNSDREVLELVGYEKRRMENCTYIQTYELKSRFTYGKSAKEERELEKINQKLKLEDLLPFDKGKTILDNLLDMQKKLRISTGDKFDKPLKIMPEDVEKVCLMILLAQNEKVTARELVQCGLSAESVKLRKELKITIEEDHRNLLTLNTYDSAGYQIVCNAKVWILDQLRETGKNVMLQKTIVQAFQRLVRDFLGDTLQFKRVETLVKFDKLNEIFPGGKRLIGDIYKALKPTLSESYQYYHQYAKCHLWGMSKHSYKIEELERARIASLTALSMVDAEMDIKPMALPHRMARAHILNTLTIIYTKLCFMEQFKSAETIEETINYFHMAINCTENYSAMLSAKRQSKNAREEEGGVIKSWINSVVGKNIRIPAGSKDKLRQILNYWNSLN